MYIYINFADLIAVPLYAEIQLGQPSVIPPRLVLEVGGDFSLAGSHAWRAEVPPYLEP